MNQGRFPLVKTFGAEIDGVHTDFSITSYEDSFFVIITQLQKLGTIVRSALDVILIQCQLYYYA